MGSEGSHSTQNDTTLAPNAKQRKKKEKRTVLQAKVDELEAQNNKIAIKNEVLQEQYEKLFETFHEARHAQTHKLVAPVEVNHQLGAPQHGGSPAFDIDIPNRERATHRCDNQHETSLNPVASTRSRRSGGRHLLAEGAEGSKTVYRDCWNFLKQRRENSIHISLRSMTQGFLKARSPTTAQAGYQFGEGATSYRETRRNKGLRDVPTYIPWKSVRRV
ncbi:hypothetical protein ACFX10_040225 [Malus domestica]